MLHSIIVIIRVKMGGVTKSPTRFFTASSGRKYSNYTTLFQSFKTNPLPCTSQQRMIPHHHENSHELELIPHTVLPCFTLGDALGPVLGDEIGESLGAALGPAMGDALGAALRPALGEALGPALGAALGTAL
jgi:hypothetical protein